GRSRCPGARAAPEDATATARVPLHLPAIRVPYPRPVFRDTAPAHGGRGYSDGRVACPRLVFSVGRFLRPCSPPIPAGDDTPSLGWPTWRHPPPGHPPAARDTAAASEGAADPTLAESLPPWSASP